jgi:hypothetical protein
MTWNKLGQLRLAAKKIKEAKVLYLLLQKKKKKKNALTVFFFVLKGCFEKCLITTTKLVGELHTSTQQLTQILAQWDQSHSVE